MPIIGPIPKTKSTNFAEFFVWPNFWSFKFELVCFLDFFFFMKDILLQFDFKRFWCVFGFEKIFQIDKTYMGVKKDSIVSFMKKKKSKKVQAKSNKKNQELGQTKNSAKLVLFVFGIGPIIGIIIFLYSKGFFNSPTI